MDDTRPNDNNQVQEQDMVVSYLTIRKAVGYLGFTFPFILALGTWLIGHCVCIEDSVSSYYYTIMGSYFVGALSAVGLFLFCYKGYDTIDQILSRAASVFILGVAFLPTNSISPCNCNIYEAGPNAFLDTAHFVTAAIFFGIMAYMSLFIFTKTDPTQPPTKQKLQRNKIYKVCGYLMIVFLLLIPALKIPAIPKSFFNYRPEFWFETIVLGAFGFSWLTKGEAILQDE
jgi:hypothetical protein